VGHSACTCPIFTNCIGPSALSGKRSKRVPKFVKSGEVITCIIEIEQMVCMEPFEQCPQVD
jgi:translation elongation factor EF-1alpha